MARRDPPSTGGGPPPGTAVPGNSLLGDLESIRSLLDEGAHARTTRLRDEPAEVPMLDDVVEGALRIEENRLGTDRAFEDDVSGPSALADDAIEALMGDEWRESADRIIRTARRAMMGAARRLTEDDTRSLDESLRARIDGALNDWMAEITLNHIDELRERILDAIGDEVRRLTDALQKTKDASSDENPDGR
jgi:hypothetical protein